MARTVKGVKQNILDSNDDRKDDSPRRSPRKKIIKETDKSPRKKNIRNNDKSPRRSPRKRKREEDSDKSEEETKIIDNSATKRRRIRDHITSAYQFSQRYNCSFALVIQVEGSSDVLVAGIGYTLGFLRKKKQIRTVRWNPPPTKGKYSPSREVCKNVKMNESIKPRVTKVKNKTDPQKKKTSPTKQTKSSKSAKVDDKSQESLMKFSGKPGESHRSSKPRPSTSTTKIPAKPSTSQEKQTDKTEAQFPKEKSEKQTWDASSKTEGLEQKRSKLSSKKKEKMDHKMPPNGTIKRAVFETPAKKSAFSLL